MCVEVVVRVGGINSLGKHIQYGNPKDGCQREKVKVRLPGLGAPINKHVLAWRPRFLSLYLPFLYSFFLIASIQSSAIYEVRYIIAENAVISEDAAVWCYSFISVYFKTNFYSLL